MKKDTIRAVVTMLARTVWPWPRKDAMTEDSTTEEESRDAGDTFAGLPYRARTWHGHWGAERIADGWSFYGDRKSDARELCDELNGLARELDAAREEAEAMKSRLKWAEAAVAKLEADIAAGSERSVETSPIADGGRYSLMEGETYKVHNEIFLRHATDEDGWFWACASDPGEAEDFCTRLNRERDARIAAEAELAALKAQQANGSGIPNGSGVAPEEPGVAEGSKPTEDRMSDAAFRDAAAMRVWAGGHVATAEEAFAQAARLVSERARLDAEGGEADGRTLDGRIWDQLPETSPPFTPASQLECRKRLRLPEGMSHQALAATFVSKLDTTPEIAALVVKNALSEQPRPEYRYIARRAIEAWKVANR